MARISLCFALFFSLATACGGSVTEKAARSSEPSSGTQPAESTASTTRDKTDSPGNAARPAESASAGQTLPETIPAPDDVASPPEGAEKTASGLCSKVLTAGTGSRHPSATDTVEVHYTGWTTDGQMFDSSRTRGQTASFPLNRVIAGWTEGLQLMVEGESRRFWIPEELAYKGRPGRPQGMLVFDVELIQIKNQ